MRIVRRKDKIDETIFFVPTDRPGWVESLLALTTDGGTSFKVEIDSTNDLIYPAYGWVKV